MRFYLWVSAPESVPEFVDAENEIEAAQIFQAKFQEAGSYLHVYADSVTRVKGRPPYIRHQPHSHP